MRYNGDSPKQKSRALLQQPREWPTEVRKNNGQDNPSTAMPLWRKFDNKDESCDCEE